MTTRAAHLSRRGLRAAAFAVPAHGRRWIAAVALAGLCGIGPAVAQPQSAPPAAAAPAKGTGKALNLFLKPFRQCNYAARNSDFAAFSDALAHKFRNASGFKGPSAEDSTVPVPGFPFVSGIQAVSYGDHTLVSVGLNGTFRKLPVQKIEFSFGNENGINAATLVFDASRQSVVETFGSGIARGERKSRQQTLDSKTKDGKGYSAIIPPNDPGRISCDWSH